MSRHFITALCALCLLLSSAIPAWGDPALRNDRKKADDEFVVVLDPGHGGKDFGAIGAITNEKTINLAVAKIVRDIIQDEAPHIKVVMTRSTDVFVTLNGRPEIAHKAGGDLFVSIHTNSVATSNPNRKTVAGASVYTVGIGKSDENLAVAMRENAVMTLEPDYTTAYEGFDPNSAESYIIFEMDRDLHLEQSIKAAREVQRQLTTTAGRRDRGIMQAGFLVLRYTSMPSILIELDFICNPTQEKFMASAEGQRAMGEAIADGILNYTDMALRARAHITGKAPKSSSAQNRKRSSKRRGAAPAPTRAAEVDAPAEPPASAVASGVPSELRENTDSTFYRIQFLTTPSELKAGDSRLKDLPPAPINFYRHGGMVKYILGRFASESDAAEALKAVRRRYADAFIITTRGNSRL